MLGTLKRQSLGLHVIVKGDVYLLGLIPKGLGAVNQAGELPSVASGKETQVKQECRPPTDIVGRGLEFAGSYKVSPMKTSPLFGDIVQ